MKKIILLIPFLYFSVCMAQSIDFQEVIPSPISEDGDFGSIDFADVDDDGDADLITSRKFKTTLYKNDGAGNFTEVLGTPFVGVFGGTTKFADVDKDGDADVLITGQDNRPVQFANLYLNDGLGNFSLMPGTPFPPTLSGDFEFADVDNDGDQDVLMTGYIRGGGPLGTDIGFAKLYINNGSGGFSEAMGTPFESVKTSSVAFIDIDNDDDLDVLIAGENDSENPVTRLYLNDSLGNFTLVANTPFPPFSQGDISIADTDNDGDMDVFICGMDSSYTPISKLFKNDGTGTFSELTGTPFPGIFLGTSDFADFDKDGDVDLLLTGTAAGGGVSGFITNIYENKGANSFMLADSLVGVAYSSTAIADMDGDQDLDLVVAGGSFFGNQTRTYRNLNPMRTAIDDEATSLSPSIYPNPSDGLLYVELHGAATATIEVFNTTGKLVYVNEHVQALNDPIQLNLPAGLFVVIIKTQYRTTTHKLVVK